MKQHTDRKHVLQVIAFTLTIAAALVVLLVPGYMEMRLTNDGPGQVKTSALLETVGPSIFVPLLILWL
jgi:cbb3-type cytochrome oxidase cytochrome c subunit